jgi:tyrosinase
MFWLHHSMVDRSWWVWQNQSPLERTFQIAGTRTMRNIPPSGNTTMEDIIDLKYLLPPGDLPPQIRHHLSTAGGLYCYSYL